MEKALENEFLMKQEGIKIYEILTKDLPLEQRETIQSNLDKLLDNSFRIEIEIEDSLLPFLEKL